MAFRLILSRRTTRFSLLPLLPPSSAFSSDASDFEADPDDPITAAVSTSVDADLPALLRHLSDARSRSSSQEEALALVRAASEITPSTTLARRALWELRRDWETAFLAFRWARECLVDCPEAWHLMIWALGKEKRFDIAWFLLRRMHCKSVVTRRALIIMIERYAAANEVDKALKTFYAMDKFRMNADSTAFYALLRALCKNNNVELAEDLLLQSRKFFPLETESFNIILDGWCNVITDVAEAKRVWREMSSYCITPDGTSYSHMIRCFSKSGNLFDSVRLYDEMNKRGWIPGLGVYNYLIYALTRENCLKETQNVFNKISEAGLQPSAETYNSMLHALCEMHKLEQAREVVDIMVEKGIHPTAETYHALAEVEDTEGTLKLLKRMNDAGCSPNIHTFHLVFDKFFRMGRSESALRMWAEMRRYDVTPDCSLYLKLIQGLATRGWMPKALELYNEMKSKGFSSDPKLEKLFDAFLSKNKDHWGRGGKLIAHRNR